MKIRPRTPIGVWALKACNPFAASAFQNRDLNTFGSSQPRRVLTIRFGSLPTATGLKPSAEESK